MELFLSGPSFRYECENLCRLFFPYSPVKVEELEDISQAACGEGPWAAAGISEENGAYRYEAVVSDGER